MSERYNASLTNWDDGTSRAHLMRYFIARGFIEPNDEVLDACCGTGYGSQLLSTHCQKITGIDYNDDAIALAEDRKIKNAFFILDDIDNLERYDLNVDVTVCLETLEHLRNPQKFVETIAKITKRLIIFSVPFETDEEKVQNEWHLNQFNENSIIDLVVQSGWKMFHSVRQGPYYIGIAYHD